MTKAFAWCMLLASAMAVADPAITDAPAPAGSPTKSTHASGHDSLSISRGRTGFADSCARCHGAKLAGGGAPALVGSSFRSRWLRVGNGIAPLDAAIRRMPKEAPDSLPAETYVDIREYILAANRGNGIAEPRATGGAPADLPTIPLAVSAASTTEPTEPELLHPLEGDWLSYNRDLQGQRHSRLAQVNRGNASGL